MTREQIALLEARIQSKCPVRVHVQSLPKEVAERHERIVRVCLNPLCKVTFFVKPFRIKHGGGQFCSRKCHGEYRKQISSATLDKYRQRKAEYMRKYREKRKGKT